MGNGGPGSFLCLGNLKCYVQSEQLHPAEASGAAREQAHSLWRCGKGQSFTGASALLMYLRLPELLGDAP